NPVPAYGGAECSVNDLTESMSCKVQECPANRIIGLSLHSTSGNVTLIGLEMTFVMSVEQIGENPTFTWDFGGGFKFNVVDPALSLDVYSSYRYEVSHTFIQEGSYDVTISGINQHGNTSATVTIDVLEGNCPGNVTFTMIDGGTLVHPSSFLARLPIHVSGTALFSCEHSSVEYTWQLYELTSIHPYPSASNLVDTNDTDVLKYNNDLHIGVMALDYGIYVITLEAVAKHSGSPVGSLYKQGYIKVKPLPLVAIIKGGTSRSVNSMDTVFIDASLSYDPDDDVLHEDVMKFEWSCSKYEGNCELPGLSNCTEEALNGSCILWSSDTSIQLTDANFTVSNSALIENDPYLFTLTVRKANRDPVSFTQMIVVVSAEKPNVHLLCLQNCNYKVTPNSKLSMAAHCTNCQRQSDLNFDWSIISVDCEFTMDWASMSFTGQFGQAVSFRPRVFQKGCSFILHVNGVKKSGAGVDSGFASFLFRTNTPPIAPYRSCIVSPSIGVTLFDEFDIYCDNFEDEDVPLTYEFYYVKVEDSTGSLLAYTDKPELLGVQLGPGDSESNYTVEIHIDVTDYLQATTTEVVSLQVYPSHMQSFVYPETADSTNELVETLTNLTVTTHNQESKLDNLLHSGDTQAASQLVFTVSAILNMESHENTTNTNVTYNETMAMLEQRSLIRDSIVTSLANTSVDVDDITVLKQKAGAMHSITVESTELAPSTK
ncbi:unnamed protein product, partial [Owenia fusiformis]